MLALLSATAAADQDRHWWLGFADNPGEDLRLSLQIDASQPVRLRVRIRGLGVDQRVAVEPGRTTVVDLPAAALTRGTSTVAHGIEVATDGAVPDTATISVRALNRRPNSSDAFLVLPDHALGSRYRLLGYPGLRGSATSQALAVALHDGTEVHIAETPRCPPASAILAAGEVWLATCTDTSGAVLTATEPVAVFGGAACAEVPEGAEFCSHLAEQLPPTEHWGDRFIAVPTAGRRASDRLRVLADRDGTEVRIDGRRVATLDGGAFHEQVLDRPVLIETSAPALVAQYAGGSSVDRLAGDPFMALVPALSQHAPLHLLGMPALAADPDDAGAGNAFAHHHLTLVVAADDVAALRLDGQSLPAARFEPVGDGRWRVAQIEIAPGSHRVEGARPFGSLLQGAGDNDSYGLPGALAMPAPAAEAALPTP